MAGVITHLLVGRQLLKKQKLISAKYQDCFLLGNCFPDAAYFPGENSLISDLAHYLMAARIPYYLYQKTNSESWKAFALGWLFHLQTDFALHPLVNKFAAQYHYGVEYKNQIFTFEQNPQVHALIENELDNKLIKESDIERLNLISPELTGGNPVSKVLEDMYSLKFEAKQMDKLIVKLPGKLKFIYGNLVKLEKLKVLKFFLLLILEIVKKLLNESKYRMIKNFIKPEQINEEKFLEYKLAIEKLIENFSRQNTPQWFDQDYNFDTGRISEIGEYGLADKLFAEIEKTKTPKSLLWSKFKGKFIKREEE